MNLTGKTILVTGATSGIGRATCTSLLDAGAFIVAVGRNEARLAEIAKEGNGRCESLRFDLAQLDELPQLTERLPELDGAIMSAGIVKNNPIKYFDRRTLDEILSINLLSPILLTVALANGGRLKRGASLVLLSSIDGTSVAIKGTVAYAASKAGLVGAAKALALELSGREIRVNVVAPGMVATEMVANASELSSEMIKADMAKYPLGKRYARAAEVASLITYLVSDRSGFITGQTVTIDGGFGLQ
jgi:NAD(P)-dependent dehydrogenase (short-subunit alcohol dehydrogenase family)